MTYEAAVKLTPNTVGLVQSFSKSKKALKYKPSLTGAWPQHVPTVNETTYMWIRLEPVSLVGCHLHTSRSIHVFLSKTNCALPGHFGSVNVLCNSHLRAN